MDAATRLLADVNRALKDVEPAAFFVPPRIMRRVIRHEHEVAGLGFQVPHRKSYVISKDRLAFLVEPDELGLEDAEEFPDVAILLAQPDEQRLPDMRLPELLTRVWRLLFHARVHLAYDRRLAAGEVTLADVRERVDRIGQVEFDEMHAVTRQEGFLLLPCRAAAEYVEVAAVYLELRMFAPHCLPAYFPALLGEFDRVDDVMAEDLDANRLFADTRPRGAPFPTATTALVTDNAAPPQPSQSEPLANGKPRPRAFARLMRKADKVSAQGNRVKAAILRTRAARYGDAESAAAARAGAARELDELVRRLQAALGFDDHEARDWREAFDGLLAKSLEGFWRADKRLLYDLQKVCVDHEREISKVDLAAWLLSFGRRPLKRLLPNQREVLMSKHLRRATDRLSVARLSGAERERLSHLLHDAAKAAERQMRSRLRPLVRQALDDVGLVPENLPERVSRDKLVEELLDAVARRGFLNMGILRDALSRSQLKLPDLADIDRPGQSAIGGEGPPDDDACPSREDAVAPDGPAPGLVRQVAGTARRLVMRVAAAAAVGALRWWRGDPLLRADRRLTILLDGVYRPGEFYLRFLQRLSAVGFGTWTGRFITRYVAIPFGGALMLIEFGKEIHHKVFAGDDAAQHLAFGTADFWLAVLALGGFLFGMIHAGPFRRLLWELVKLSYRAVRGVLFDLPRGFLQLEFVRALRRSRPYELFGRFVLKPLFYTLVVWLTLGLGGVADELPPWWAAAVFALLAIVLNLRISRDIEEVTTERVHKIWYRIRVHVFVALFDLIMGAFKRLLEWIERLLYAVDEWLRFKSGETVVTLASKAVLGVAWAVVAYVVRFCVTLLVEPQINPIKHFPTVTVAHKIILPLAYAPTATWATRPSPLASLLLVVAPLSVEAANTICLAVVWGIPGIFGFLVWELKENWRLYAANRSPRLKPVLVGDHGETLPRLIRPGFHSGTLPRLYKKLRRAHRKTRPGEHNPLITRYEEKLHHCVEAIRHFVERELLGLLAASRTCGGLRLVVGEIHAACNSVRVELKSVAGVSPASMWLAFQEQSGWLVAGITAPGWLDQLSEQQRETVRLALAGLYKLSGVELVREQLEECFQPALPPYDITDRGLVVWPDGRYESVVRYDLDQRPVMRPRPQSAARAFNLPLLEAHEAVFEESEIGWREWVWVWDSEREGESLRLPTVDGLRLLPDPPSAAKRASVVEAAT
ncbi:MAG TPA: hypothetical protein VML55_22605 [Planctomycetaceae bacterium]|nr:hypothetical protein [Planctomycetaceae bacterium]